MMTKDNPDEWNTTPSRTSSSTSGRKRLDWLSALETVTDTIMSMFLENRSSPGVWINLMSWKKEDRRAYFSQIVH
jgi:hypothetical protein